MVRKNGIGRITLEKFPLEELPGKDKPDKGENDIIVPLVDLDSDESQFLSVDNENTGSLEEARAAARSASQRAVRASQNLSGIAARLDIATRKPTPQELDSITRESQKLYISKLRMHSFEYSSIERAYEKAPELEETRELLKRLEELEVAAALSIEGARARQRVLDPDKHASELDKLAQEIKNLFSLKLNIGMLGTDVQKRVKILQREPGTKYNGELSEEYYSCMRRCRILKEDWIDLISKLHQAKTNQDFIILESELSAFYPVVVELQREIGRIYKILDGKLSLQLGHFDQTEELEVEITTLQIVVNKLKTAIIELQRIKREHDGRMHQVRSQKVTTLDGIPVIKPHDRKK